MKRILLFALMLTFAVTSMAQLSKYATKYRHAFPKNTIDNVVVNPAQPFNPTVSSKAVLEDQLGTTVYDLQTNESPQNRINVYPDGTINGSWMFGTTDPSFTERGTGYNYYDGTAWGDSPTSRIESIRTGWPSLCQWMGNGELVIAHNSTATLIMNTRPVKGTGAWTQSLAPATPAGAPALGWPRAMTSGSNHQNIHVLALTMPTGNGGAVYNGLDGALLYWRSTDGGTTWDKAGIQLPTLTSDNYDSFSGDEYSWGSPHGDTIYFCCGGIFTDTFVMESIDNGDTWTRTNILSNANCKIDPTVQEIAPWTMTDGSCTCEMGPGGVIHFAAGIGSGFVTGGAKYFYSNLNGLVYWNSTMAMLPDSLDLTTLQNNGQLAGYYADGPLPGDSLLVSPPSYRVSLTSLPQLSFDTHGNMYLLYSGITSQNPEPSTNYAYRHMFGNAWYSGHSTWSLANPMDLNAGNLYIFSEYTFPSMAKTVLAKTNSALETLEYLYQTASSPGTAVGSATGATPLPYKTCTIEHRSLLTSTFISDGVENKNSRQNAVAQNYPNPVQGKTAFAVTVANNASVITEVSNITGQKVMTIESGVVTSGTHMITIDASQFTAGVYFYSVKINGQAYTHKMIVE